MVDRLSWASDDGCERNLNHAEYILRNAMEKRTDIVYAPYCKKIDELRLDVQYNER